MRFTRQFCRDPVDFPQSSTGPIPRPRTNPKHDACRQVAGGRHVSITNYLRVGIESLKQSSW